MLGNIYRSKGTQPFKPSDFVPEYKIEKQQSIEEMKIKILETKAYLKTMAKRGKNITARSSKEEKRKWIKEHV